MADQQADSLQVPGPPYVGTLTFCERAIHDSDGVFTLVRLFDEITLRVPEEFPELGGENAIPIELSFFVGLKGTDQVPWEPLSLDLIPPSGQFATEQRLETNPHPDKANLNIAGSIGFSFTEPGMYWFRLRVGDRVLSQIPLRITIQRVSASEMALRPVGFE